MNNNNIDMILLLLKNSIVIKNRSGKEVNDIKIKFKNDNEFIQFAGIFLELMKQYNYNFFELSMLKSILGKIKKNNITMAAHEAVFFKNLLMKMQVTCPLKTVYIRQYIKQLDTFLSEITIDFNFM